MGGSAKTDFVCYKGPKSADDGGRVGQKIQKIADVSCVRPLSRKTDFGEKQVLVKNDNSFVGTIESIM